jgi:hypothetical protein
MDNVSVRSESAKLGADSLSSHILSMMEPYPLRDGEGDWIMVELSPREYGSI